MNRYILYIVLMVGILLATFPKSALGQDVNDVDDQNDVDSIIIALTRLDVNDLIPDLNDQIPDVNDQTLDVNVPALELRYKIINNSDQDVWICDDISLLQPYQEEVYFEFDVDQTLVIRKRFDVSTLITWTFQPVSKYVRLRAGQNQSETLSFTLPVSFAPVFTTIWPGPGIEYARRIVVEIGYHTKDLPRVVSRWEPYPDPNTVEEVVMDYYDSANEGEQILRITVDGVLIPFGRESTTE